jgi:single-strand DNA-binding protein
MTTPITIVGNLTDEPELRFTPNGAAVVRFSIAVNRRTYDKAKQAWTEAGVDYHRVQAWQGLAENIAETLTKGQRAIVFGDLEQQHWVDKKTGEKKSSWLVIASSVGPDLTWATAKVTKARRQNSAPDPNWDNASADQQSAPDWAATGGN